MHVFVVSLISAHFCTFTLLVLPGDIHNSVICFYIMPLFPYSLYVHVLRNIYMTIFYFYYFQLMPLSTLNVGGGGYRRVLPLP